MPKPNVLFIMADQQRFDTIGLHRHPCADYPNMEALRQESVCFDRFYASATPCVPSRANFLTGKNAWNYECCGNARFYTNNESLSPQNRTWMQTLRDNGYACVSVGKTHMVHAGSYHVQVPLRRSFGDEDGWNHFYPKATPERDEDFFDVQVATRACEIIERMPEEPFALFVGFHAPHEPYVMPEKYLSFCKPEDVPLPADWNAQDGHCQEYYNRLAHFRRMFGNCIDDEEIVRRAIAAYFCALKMVDDGLGRIITKLKEQNLWDNTLVIYTSDHGEMLGNHHLFNKNATCYEQEAHIPFMMKLPRNVQAGTIVPHLAAGLDWYPTVMDILGIKEDVPLPGHSLLPCIVEGKPVRDYVLTWYCDSSMAIRTDEYMLMYDPHNCDGELYDLKNDAAECKNLYNNPEYAPIRSKMIEKMLTQRMIEDGRASKLTEREYLLYREIYASGESEVCLLPPRCRSSHYRRED